jgi:hypothetical protein
MKVFTRECSTCITAIGCKKKLQHGVLNTKAILIFLGLSLLKMLWLKRMLK